MEIEMTVKRLLFLCALPFVACSDDGGGPDARPGPDAAQAVDARPGSALATGDYPIAWTCERSCVTDIPYAATRTLRLDMAALTFELFTANQPETYHEGTLTARGQGCYDLVELDDVIEAYACDGITGKVSMLFPGSTSVQRVWRFDEVRPSSRTIVRDADAVEALRRLRAVNEHVVLRAAGHGLGRGQRQYALVPRVRSVDDVQGFDH